jgi:SRSO17 transposase
LSHFTSNSPWNDVHLTEQIGQDAVALIGPEGALILDESGCPKQGDKSVGVARQYCGRLGKVDNCQVGVFVAYAKAGQTTLIDKRLYLPQEWIDNPQRCRQAGVPEEEIVFRKKSDLGLELILQARKNQIPFEFVGMDAHYGQQPWLLSRLETENIEYMAEIPSNTWVYLEYPPIGIPERKGNKGREPSKTRVLDGQPIEVRSLLETDKLKWTVLKVRDTARGELWIKFATLRVYRIEDELPVTQSLWLCIRQELDSGEIKFAFSNAPTNSPQKILANKMCTRYWVERAIEDAKGLAGLDEYQVIGWRGWHHHMTMTMLAMLFLVTLRKNLAAQAPMLTLQDAKQILEILLPKKSLTLEDAVKIIEQKHWNRYCSRSSRLKKQRKQLQMYHFH